MQAIAERHYIAVPNGTGDTKTIWNPDAPDEVEAARDTFKSLRKKGYAIYRAGTDGERGEVMSEFDPQARKLIAVRAVVGG